MEERLKKILDAHYSSKEKYKYEKEELLNSIRFYQSHGFKEEERIARIKYDAMDMLMYNYNSLYNEVKEALTDWQS